MFQIKFSTANEAFDGVKLELEIAAILKAVANQIAKGSRSGNARDTNGNTVGAWKLGNG